MKRILLFVEFIILFILLVDVVHAKDSVYSLNKNNDERFNYVINSYDNDLKKDGVVAAGSYQNIKDNSKEESSDYQIMLVKYSNNGEIKWKYSYGKSKADTLDYLTYTYDNEGKIDGYFLVLEKTKDSQENVVSTSTFLKVDLEGKLVFEKDSNLNQEEHITKIIPITEDDCVNSYIAIAQNKSKNTSFLIKYDKDFNSLWNISKNNPDGEVNYLDITIIQNEKEILGYALIEEVINNEETTKNLISFNKDGMDEKRIQEKLEKYETTFLEKSDNGFILYGITNDVKIKNGESSYYLIKYSSNKEVNWEVVGDIPIDNNKKIILKPKISENKPIEYMLLYSNGKDDSYEVISLDEEGLLKKKIKKINNNYYDIEDFLVKKNTIYLVGQIDCPEDDNCDYDKNSLLLISDEDKVIEVEDKESTNILFIFGGIVFIIFIAFYLKKKGIQKKTDD